MAYVPYGDDLCSGYISTGTLVKDPLTEVVTITFGSSVELTEGSVYSIVCKCPTGSYINAEINNAVTWQQATFDGYANGTKCLNPDIDDDYTWTAYGSRDCYFVTLSGENEKDSYTGGGALQFVYGDWGVAQTFIAGSTYTITGVKLKLGRSIAAENPGTLYISIRQAIDVPGKATNPAPTNELADVTLDETPLSWDASDPVADYYNVYFRQFGNDWELVGDAQEEIEFAVDFGTLAYGITYEWRVDAVNAAGTTTGDIWSFTCILFDPPLPAGITLDWESDPPGQPTGTPTGENNMFTVKRLIAAANNAIWYGGV